MFKTLNCNKLFLNNKTFQNELIVSYYFFIYNDISCLNCLLTVAFYEKAVKNYFLHNVLENNE